MSVTYGIVFLMLASAFALTGCMMWADFPLGSACTGYAALSFLLVGGAYLGGGPAFLLKRPDGRMRWLSWLLYGPYHLLNALAFWLYRRTERKAPFARLGENLYFGRRLTAQEARLAAEHGWVGVLDLTGEFAEVHELRGVKHYRLLPLLDATAPAAADLREALAWLDATLKEGPVYLHCALGHGRTGTVLVAHLLATRSVATVAQGLARVRALRPGVGLHPSQRRLLCQLEQQGA